MVCSRACVRDDIFGRFPRFFCFVFLLQAGERKIFKSFVLPFVVALSVFLFSLLFFFLPPWFIAFVFFPFAHSSSSVIFTSSGTSFFSSYFPALPPLLSLPLLLLLPKPLSFFDSLCNRKPYECTTAAIACQLVKHGNLLDWLSVKSTHHHVTVRWL